MTQENVLYLRQSGRIEHVIERPGRRLEPPPGVADWIGVDVVSIACAQCGGDVVQKPKGYLANYCSALCRSRGYAARMSPEQVADLRRRQRERRRRPASPVESLPGEVWRAIPGFEGRYEASSLGRVKSLRRYSFHESETRSDWKAQRQEQLLKPSPNRGGYLRVTLSDSNQARHDLTVHRLVCLAFHGQGPSPQHVVRHLNGDSQDNRSENVAWGTVTDNNRDTVVHGTHFNTRKTHCPQGHEFTPENTIIRTYESKNDSRYCRICKNEANSRWARNVRERRAS